MHQFQIPSTMRPGGRVRRLNLGVEVPSYFLDGLKAIDEKLYLVWHPVKLMWDEMMNTGAGELENPRFYINIDPRYGGEEMWGWVLTDGEGRPKPENKWHVWRLCEPHGWAHIFPVDVVDRQHLDYYLDRFFLRSQIQDKYGHRGWSRYEQEMEELIRQKEQAELADLHAETMRQNKKLIREAIENMERGIINPTNPTKDVITSYKGQTNRSRIVRPIDDREGGLYTPDQWN